MSLKLYQYYLCPFCKPINFLLDVNKVEYENIPVNLPKQEHKTEEYKKINPFQKVPAIVEGDFILFESSTLSRYLSNTKNIDDHWYPKDPKKRAIVDLYYDWHAANILNLQSFAFFKYGMSKKTEEEARAISDKAFAEFVSVFLSQRKFIASDDKLTIADVALIYHLSATLSFGYEVPKRVQEYYNDVLAASDELKEDVKKYLDDRNAYIESVKTPK